MASKGPLAPAIEALRTREHQATFIKAGQGLEEFERNINTLINKFAGSDKSAKYRIFVPPSQDSAMSINKHIGAPAPAGISVIEVVSPLSEFPLADCVDRYVRSIVEGNERLLRKNLEEERKVDGFIRRNWELLAGITESGKQYTISAYEAVKETLMKKNEDTNIDEINLESEELKQEIKETEARQGLWDKLWRAASYYGPERDDDDSDDDQ